MATSNPGIQDLFTKKTKNGIDIYIRPLEKTPNKYIVSIRIQQDRNIEQEFKRRLLEYTFNLQYDIGSIDLTTYENFKEWLRRPEEEYLTSYGDFGKPNVKIMENFKGSYENISNRDILVFFYKEIFGEHDKEEKQPFHVTPHSTPHSTPKKPKGGNPLYTKKRKQYHNKSFRKESNPRRHLSFLPYSVKEFPGVIDHFYKSLGITPFNISNADPLGRHL